VRGLRLLGLAILVAACTSGGAIEETSGVRFLFALQSDPSLEAVFVATTFDPEMIRVARAQLDLPRRERRLHINGVIAGGNGGHNLGWSWHFVPGAWHLTEVSTGLCDGTPEMVERDLSYWLDRVQRFCPWQSYVLREWRSG
jgi:hypothetical protein